MLKRILQLLEGQQELSSFPKDMPQKSVHIYDNKSLMALLGVKDKYIKRLRDNGLIGYSRHGDKYWYTQEDVDRFLKGCHYKAFASPGNSIFTEGGGL